MQVRQSAGQDRTTAPFSLSLNLFLSPVAGLLTVRFLVFVGCCCCCCCCCCVRPCRDFSRELSSNTGSEEGALSLPDTVSQAYAHALPQGELALVKELLKVGDGGKVEALLRKSFAEAKANVAPHKLMQVLFVLIHESELEDNQRLKLGGTQRPSKQIVDQMRMVRERGMTVLYELSQLSAS
mmetsp:Transcript_10291/g.25739  ORF Transcript_10291/g.25739 Transcript_10291/m.25739 type:complete len:182 (+) Transcript_10291:765-1310(+)